MRRSAPHRRVLPASVATTSLLLLHPAARARRVLRIYPETSVTFGAFTNARGHGGRDRVNRRIPACLASGRGLLLSEAVQCAESPDEIDGVDADDLPIGHE